MTDMKSIDQIITIINLRLDLMEAEHKLFVEKMRRELTSTGVEYDAKDQATSEKEESK